MTEKLALIGFGEAGSTFATAAHWSGQTAVWDVCANRRAAAKAAGLHSAIDAQEALAEASIVLCLVTADQALSAAQDYAPNLAPDAIWCDMNSVAPQTKRAAAEAIEAAGGHYVDVAVMAPVIPAALNVPLLGSGPKASYALDQLGALGFSSASLVGEAIGRASAIKLCRSIIVKGTEALCAEMALAAAKLGVLDAVLASLDASEKPQSWQDKVDYSLDRMMAHGDRRSAEMDEARLMLGNADLSALMTAGTVDWQRAIGGVDLSPPHGLSEKIAAISTALSLKGVA